MSRSVECALRLFLTGVAVAYSAEPPAGSLETQVKAAFVYNFAKFVQWPDAKSSSGDAFCFCVIGSEPLYEALQQSLIGKTISGRPVSVRRIENGAGDPHCNVVFIGRADEQHLNELLDVPLGSQSLTVSDLDQFVERGGMIQLIKKDNRFRFAINAEAVNRSRLRISAQLLQLAIKAPAAAGTRSKP